MWRRRGSLVFHFAGRPVAQLDLAAGAETWKYLTTDHLGTPIAATGMGGTLLWQGGFEPFGADWSGAGAAGVFLRFPGQWEKDAWAGGSEGLYYNVHRWYEVGVGRYTKPDPIGLAGGGNLYSYSGSSPVTFSDPTGLQMKEGIPTKQEIARMTQQACAREAFYRNYRAMREANWKLSDKYFHCKANCQAARCGEYGFKEACGLSDLREFFDQVKGDPPSASEADQVANRFGREMARKNPESTCPIICSQYRSKGLPAKY